MPLDLSVYLSLLHFFSTFNRNSDPDPPYFTLVSSLKLVRRICLILTLHWLNFIARCETLWSARDSCNFLKHYIQFEELIDEP